MLSGYKNSLEKYPEVLESSEKVLEFRVSNIVGTLYYIVIKSKIHIANSYLKRKTNRLIC